MDTARVDLLYLAHNRLEFTRDSFGALLENTDPDLVRRLYVYDDDSSDGTAEHLQKALQDCPMDAEFRQGVWGSSVGPLCDFIGASESLVLAKIDNDVMLPAGWLNHALSVLARAPSVELLGIEPMGVQGGGGGWRSSRFIGGIGLFRRKAFSGSRGLPVPGSRYFGFTEWQMSHGVRCAWLDPPIDAFLLDRMPIEPWLSLSERYVREGWQRPWPKYELSQSDLWKWWANGRR